MALSKFGTFKTLSGTTSSDAAVHPGGPTFSFYGATYTSRYLSFVTDEENPSAVHQSASSFGSVQTLTEQEHNIITSWDVAPYTAQSGSIPFVDIGGEFVLTGVQYEAGAISQMSFRTATGVMTSGKSAVSHHVDAAAGYLLGDICAVTRQQPSYVCRAGPVQARRRDHFVGQEVRQPDRLQVQVPRQNILTCRPQSSGPVELRARTKA